MARRKRDHTTTLVHLLIKFTSSDLNRNPAKVLAAAREDAVIIQIKRTNGEVAEEFVLALRKHTDL